MNLQERIDTFLGGSPLAVVGASRDRSKYGNRVLRAYLGDGRVVFPINPNAEEIEGVRAYPDLASVPEPVHGVSVITPPEVTETVVRQAGELGIKNVWLQPGAESDAALSLAEELGLNLIARGPCVLVILAGQSQ